MEIDDKVKQSGKDRGAIDQLSAKIIYLSRILKKSTDESSKLQKWLIGWTIVMAVAVASQAVLIGIQIFG